MEEHYIGNDVPVKFGILVDGRKTRPTGVEVDVYGPDSQFILTDIARAGEPEVKYVLKKDAVTKLGTYTLIFRCSLRGYGMQSHVIKVKAKKLPVKERINQSQRDKLVSVGGE